MKEKNWLNMRLHAMNAQLSSEGVLHLLASLTPLVFRLILCFLLSSRVLVFLLLSPDPVIFLPLSLRVPSLVRFDFFHLLPNPYFYFSPCPIVTSLNSFFPPSCYPLHLFPPSSLLSLLPLVSKLFFCVCVCVCVLARGLPGNVLPHSSLCPINITR